MRLEKLTAVAVAVGLTTAACATAESTDVESAAASVVRIAGTACLAPILASGIVVAPEQVVTVAHAVAGAENDLRVVTAEGREHPVEVVGFDPELDIALLAAPGLAGPPMEPGTAAPQDVGFIAAMSGDHGLDLIDYTVLRVVNARSGDIYDEGHVERAALDIRSAATRGTSGAPLVDEEGSYVGMVFAISRDREDGVYALASSEISGFLASAVSADPVDRGRCR